jgi:dienelactone hydrolase
MKSSRSVTCVFACSFLASALMACGSGGSNGAPDLASSANADAGTDDGGIDDAAPAAGTASITFIDEANGGAMPTTGLLWTDRFDMRFAGLPPSTDVTIGARFVGWGSTAVFTSAPDGTLDVATAAPKSGSYSGADIDGLVWSMTPGTSPSDKGQNQFTLRVTASVGDTQIGAASLARYATAKNAACRNVSDNGLVGYYCAPPPGSPQRGGIVAFGGSEGGLDTGQSLAMYYAALGYPTLGLAYFGAPGVPAELSLIPLEYFQKAFAWLETQPEVTKGKIVVNGGSRGGELALLLGATFPEVTGVIANVPSGFMWGAPDATGTNEIASWTYGGKPFAFVPYVQGSAKPVPEPGGTTATEYASEFIDSINAATPAQREAASVHVENTNGPVLMFAGDDDQVWASCVLSEFAWIRLVSYGHSKKYADAFECYRGAGHNVDSFDVGVPTLYSTFAPDQGETLALGGTPIGIAHAARDADDKVRAFLATNL